MFENFFNQWLERRQEERFQLGCRDRIAGSLPQIRDSDYLKGYLCHRPAGLDNVVQYFSTAEDYLEWQRRSRNHPC